MRVILSDAIMDNEHTESRGKKRSKFNASHLAEIDHPPWAALGCTSTGFEAYVSSYLC